MSKSMLDAIVNNIPSADRGENWPLTCACGGSGGTHTAKCTVGTDHAATTSTLVPGEDDVTTHRALSEMYDRTRDKHVLTLAKLVQSYGEEMDKREISAAIAAPTLAEMRKALDRADAAQRKSASHRAAEQAAAARGSK
jgi:hypothetical protein